MFHRSEMNERHARILKRLSEIGEAVAEKLADQALAAETPEETATAAAAFDRAARGLRLTLSLEARLARHSRQDERDEHDHQMHRDDALRAARAVEAGRKVARRLVAEYEAERDEDGAHGRLMRRMKAIAELVMDAGLIIELDGDPEGDAQGLRMALDTLLPDDVAFDADHVLETG